MLFIEVFFLFENELTSKLLLDLLSVSTPWEVGTIYLAVVMQDCGVNEAISSSSLCLNASITYLDNLKLSFLTIKFATLICSPSIPSSTFPNFPSTNPLFYSPTSHSLIISFTPANSASMSLYLSRINSISLNMVDECIEMVWLMEWCLSVSLEWSYLNMVSTELVMCWNLVRDYNYTSFSCDFF